MMDVFTFLAPVYNIIFSPVQKRQGKELIKHLPSLKNKKVLDLGGGTGRLAMQMACAGADLWLLDASPQMLKQALRLLPGERVIQGDSVSLPFKDNTFDIVTMVDVFHHLKSQEKTLKECRRVLVSGGSLYLLEFHPGFISIKILAFVERLVGEPCTFILPEDLIKVLKKTGYTKFETNYISTREYITRAEKPV